MCSPLRLPPLRPAHQARMETLVLVVLLAAAVCSMPVSTRQTAATRVQADPGGFNTGRFWIRLNGREYGPYRYGPGAQQGATGDGWSVGVSRGGAWDGQGSSYGNMNRFGGNNRNESE